MVGCWVCRLNHDDARADTATAGVTVTCGGRGGGVELPHALHRGFGRSSSAPLVGVGCRCSCAPSPQELLLVVPTGSVFLEMPLCAEDPRWSEGRHWL